MEAARLLLRRWREDDLAAYARMCGDPEVMRYLSGTMTREQCQAQITSFERGWKERGFGLWKIRRPVRSSVLSAAQ
jgi:RimJ/RimL family protein N-acetyltransferase